MPYRLERGVNHPTPVLATIFEPGRSGECTKIGGKANAKWKKSARTLDAGDNGSWKFAARRLDAGCITDFGRSGRVRARRWATEREVVGGDARTSRGHCTRDEGHRGDGKESGAKDLRRSRMQIYCSVSEGACA
jgi:hypothetical protein